MPQCEECLDGEVVNDTCDECEERHCSRCEPCEEKCEGYPGGPSCESEAEWHIGYRENKSGAKPTTRFVCAACLEKWGMRK